jgi:hypothetical protein
VYQDLREKDSAQLESELFLDSCPFVYQDLRGCSLVEIFPPLHSGHVFSYFR